MMEADNRHNEKLTVAESSDTNGKIHLGDDGHKQPWSNHPSPDIPNEQRYPQVYETQKEQAMAQSHCLEHKSACVQTLNANTTPSTSATTTNISSTPDCSVTKLKPNSECKNLTSPFSTAKDGQYELHCGSDLPTTSMGADLLGVYAYTMRDCINACS
ncbi:MAG: hypothetical protein Q9179_003352 [Wetmoreana sp. 5 TL-2023]